MHRWGVRWATWVGRLVGGGGCDPSIFCFFCLLRNEKSTLSSSERVLKALWFVPGTQKAICMDSRGSRNCQKKAVQQRGWKGSTGRLFSNVIVENKVFVPSLGAAWSHRADHCWTDGLSRGLIVKTGSQSKNSWLDPWFLCPPIPVSEGAASGQKPPKVLEIWEASGAFYLHGTSKLTIKEPCGPSWPRLPETWSWLPLN